MAHVGIEMQQAGDKAGLRALSALPISFVGLGVFRAWMGVLGNVLFVSRGAEQLFDCLLAVILLSAVAFAAKLVPLCANRCAHALCLAGSLASSVAGAIGTLLLSGTAQAVCLWLALAACAIAAALFILFWCELLSCLDITRVALCLALTYLAEQVLLFFLEDLPTAKLAAASLVLPLVSQLMLVRAFSYIPADSRPRVISGKQRIPWKIVGIFALYSFVTGVRRAVFTGASSSQAAVLASLLVAGFLLVAIIVFPKRFDLTIMYRTPVFLLFCALLLIPLLGPFDRGWLPFFLAVSARLFEVVVFLLLCDISKSMGIMALVVFGIEEATVAF